MKSNALSLVCPGGNPGDARGLKYMHGAKLTTFSPPPTRGGVILWDKVPQSARFSQQEIFPWYLSQWLLSMIQYCCEFSHLNSLILKQSLQFHPTPSPCILNHTLYMTSLTQVRILITRWVGALIFPTQREARAINQTRMTRKVITEWQFWHLPPHSRKNTQGSERWVFSAGKVDCGKIGDPCSASIRTTGRLVPQCISSLQVNKYPRKRATSLQWKIDCGKYARAVISL